ncbi:N-acetylglucosamine-6-phosphate deacetylase [Granulicella pectinivorans]|uniref:N-acetylglucosamine-6-phosphate deacetylase n=1 Tax=Granulicella pectinivorans TaxID=474950 RepID=A0A1I6MY66_9BACT|nr:N-acetylglucosamine-6-phosphate deacetylase [Granulicella pectinivorans]SFS20614.1 N-acetylglucosamine-6-phosphate deacetylase [Granulicella pectinivorans]
MQTLTARRLLTPIGSVEYPVITVGDDGLIAEIESDPTLPHANDTLTAAFLDVHTHGGMSHDVMTASPKDFVEFNRFLATRGVGQYLATTVTAPIDATLRGLEAIADEIERAHDGVATPIGVHLEGPFISHAKRGVHPEGDILPPSIELFDRFQAAARGHIRLITIAPEIPGALDLIAHCKALGVRVSLGHTNATSPETQAGIDAGASSATHTYNAMRALDHRAPGVLGTVLDSSSLFAELICDGIHVAPELVRLWLKAKGPELAILVTDSMSAAGMPDGAYTLGTFDVAVAEGKALLKSDLDRGKETLAGSILTMDKAVANVQAMTGASLGIAVNLASANPARMLGLEPAIRPGTVGNFNRFAASGRLEQTILRGKAVN